MRAELRLVSGEADIDVELSPRDLSTASTLYEDAIRVVCPIVVGLTIDKRPPINCDSHHTSPEGGRAIELPFPMSLVLAY